LKRSCPKNRQQANLATFDASRDSIRDVARKVYSHGRKNVYQPRRPQRFDGGRAKRSP
jgi:hypothetical protein